MVTNAEQFKGIVRTHLPAIYNFVYRLTLDDQRALNYTVGSFEQTWKRFPPQGNELATPEQTRLWLLSIANGEVERNLPRQPEVNFDVLDDTLRADATRTDIVRSIADPDRDFLLWELKQGCMTAVINCLPPGERSAFVVGMIFRLDDAGAAQVLGTSESAYKVRLSRARKKVSDYLAPRCEHVNPMNPCRCPARVGNALNKGFISTRRPRSEISLRRPEIPFRRYGTGEGQEDTALRDIAAIYGNLPERDMPQGLLARCLMVADKPPQQKTA